MEEYKEMPSQELKEIIRDKTSALHLFKLSHNLEQIKIQNSKLYK
jgi:hypothetical protein